MKKFVFIYVVSILLYSCSNYQNEKRFEDNTFEEFESKEVHAEVTEEELVEEEVYKREIKAKYPCDRSFDEKFEFKNVCNIDQYDVFHSDPLPTQLIYRIIYQSKENRLLIYKDLDGTESISKVYENVTCELSEKDLFQNKTIPLWFGFYYIYKVSDRPILSILFTLKGIDNEYDEYSSCKYFPYQNKTKYQDGRQYVTRN